MDDFQIRQLKILAAAIADYRGGRTSLDSLVGTLSAILPFFSKEKFADDAYAHLIALEEVNASIGEPGFDMRRYGSPVVDRSIAELEVQIETLINS